MQRSNVDLPEPGRPDQADDLAGVHVEIDAGERREAAEALDHAAIADDLRALALAARLAQMPSRAALIRVTA